jgi:murein DD-endopeptidase MepM/ murein hydrolase activator NlpD
MSELKTLTAKIRRQGRGRLVAAGVCTALVVGAGGAVAAEATQDVFASGTANELSDATRQQAEAQEKRDKGDKDEKSAKDGKDADREKAEKDAAEARKGDGKKKASRSSARGAWSLPASKPYTVTATFGKSGDRWSSGHSGMDFAVPTGTDVKSVGKGTVVSAGWGGAFGNEIVVKHPTGKYTQYAHLSKIKVSPGQAVGAGKTIGQSGTTGNSSGPHLHLEVRTTPDYGSGVNPEPFLRSHGLTP